jgi:hypothetical protein
VRRAAVITLVACALAVSTRARADEVAAAEAPPARTASTYYAIASCGAAYHRLTDVPFEAGVASLAFGVDTGHLGLYVRGDYEGGRSDHGLQLRIFRVGGSAEGIVGRFRLGGGVDVSSVAFVRATNGASVGRFGAGFFGVTSLDLVRFDRHALLLGARGDVDASAHTLGATLFLGLRL